MLSARNFCLIGLFVFIAFATVSPNPFGNNPDIIADESYFLTSSLSAIEKVTLPGWEFSASGNYYGGVQTYIDTVVLIPVLGTVFVSQGFSVLSTKMWVALHTGDLLHILRMVNGLLVLLFLFFGCSYFFKRKIPTALSGTLVLFVLLLLSNALVLQFLHTAKVWVFYTLAVGLTSSVFIAHHYYLEHVKRSFIRKDVYVALLLGSSALLFFQNYVGAFSTILITLYALVLKHIEIKDLWNNIKRYWYLYGILFISQLSFLYRAVFINWLDGSFDEISTITPDHHIIWIPRLLNPLRYAALGDPLVILLYAVATVGGLVMLWRLRNTTNSLKQYYVLIACAHPVLTYLFFHVIVGFSSAPRYGLMLTVACAFSVAVLLSEMGTGFVRAGAFAAGILFLIIGIHAIKLYWHPSSEVDLLNSIIARYNSSDTVFVEEESALRLTLPVNEASLALLNEKRRSMSRFAFMIEHPSLVRQMVPFKPLTLIAYTPVELSETLASLATSSKMVWTITTDCTRVCSNAESEANTCFMFNEQSCHVAPQEVNVQSVYLSAQQLGNAYVVHRVH